MKYTDRRIKIKQGWEDAGVTGVAVGEPVFVRQFWLPVLWDDHEDPTFHKLAGIETISMD